MKKKIKKSVKKIDLQNNTKICLNSGFKRLTTSKNDEDYRFSIVTIHNGLELLMKYYLFKKNQLLILNNITHEFIISKRKDYIKKPDLKENKTYTINYKRCTLLLEYFTKLPTKNVKYLNQIEEIRNKCVHYEFTYNEKIIRKLLISHIYQFICDLIVDMNEPLEEFISKKHSDSLNKFKKTIDDDIFQNLLIKIETAKNHYFNDLTEDERNQKKETESYSRHKFDELVKCPACENNSLLTKKIVRHLARFGSEIKFKRSLILKELSCYYCALSIKEYDQLKIKFEDKEKNLKPIPITPVYSDCPDDCQVYSDCPDDCYIYDCPDDCPDDDDDNECSDCDCPDDYY